MDTKDLITEENSAAANNVANSNPKAKPIPESSIQVAIDEKEILTVGGFIFTSVEDAEVAREELKKIEYIEKKMNYHLPENILAVYNKVLESKILKTPLGIAYLNRMQGHMKRVGIEADRITPIPVYQSFTSRSLNEASEGIARQRIERRLKAERTEADRLKFRIRSLIAVCLFLGSLIAAMFYITLTSDNPNILNYEQSILDKYAEWEQNLQERESKIRARERELVEWESDGEN